MGSLLRQTQLRKILGQIRINAMSLSLADLKLYQEIAVAAAQEGGRVLCDCWGKVQNVREKEFRGDLVTEVDKESERRIVNLLKQKLPSHGLLAEESGSQITKSPFLWIIDPLDGTTNYTHQYPMVAVSIALLFNGNPIIGVVFNPILNELFQAGEGQGAFLNGKKISVSKIDQLEQSLLATGFAYDRRQNPDNNYAEFSQLTDLSQGVRRGGSAALDLAYVAAGRFDGYWERGIKSWDIAAGVVLVNEAGGKVTAYDESPFDLYAEQILATNGFIHTVLSQELKKIRILTSRSGLG